MTTREKIEVMQAYEDGKEIEFRSAHTEEVWMRCFKAIWNWEKFEYRVKPDPKPESEYVPYDSATEVEKDKWVVNRNTGVMYRIVTLDKNDNTVLLSGNGWVYPSDLFKNFMYEDGTRCGKKVET